MKTREEIINMLEAKEELFEADILYAEGVGYLADWQNTKAIECFRKSAELGFGWAQYRYAMHLQSQKDPVAEIWLEEARASLLEQDGVVLCNPEARELYAQAKYFEQVGDEVHAAEMMLRAAEAGMGDAQYEYARFLQRGKGVERSESEALKWLRKFADAKYLEFIDIIGGTGMISSPTEAEAFGAAAVYGNHRAQYEIHVLRYGGNMLSEYNPDDFEDSDREREFFDLASVVGTAEEAKKWFQKKAAEGYTDGYCAVQKMVCYPPIYAYRAKMEDFDWCSQLENDADAHPLPTSLWDADHPESWYDSMAKLGHAGLTCRLAEQLYHGKGITQNKAEGLRLYRLAAEQGSADAQYAMGEFYYYGQELDRDITNALKWYTLSALNGEHRATEALYSRKDLGLDASEKLLWLDLDAFFLDWDSELCYQLAREYDKQYYRSVGIQSEQKRKKALKYLRNILNSGSRDQEKRDHCECLLGNIWIGDQFTLARRYYDGDGVEKNLDEAYRILCALKNISEGMLIDLHPYIAEDGQWTVRRRAAKLLEELFPDRLDSIPFQKRHGDNPEDNYFYANYLYEIRGLKDEALKWYRKAAEQGYEPAQRELNAIIKPKATQPSPRPQGAAESLQTASAPQEQPPTAEQLLHEAHELLNSGETIKAADRAHRSAELGNPEAQYLYGRILSDENDAFKPVASGWYRKAAEQGYEPAQREMDKIDPNWNQPVMPQPPVEQPAPPQTVSQEQLSKTKQDCEPAQREMDGTDPTRNQPVIPQPPAEQSAPPQPVPQEQPPTAEQLLHEARELLNSGETTKAADCVHRAAELGNAEAQYLYGKILSEGNDALKAMAEKWFRMAAEQGHTPSQAEFPETQNDPASQHPPKSLLRRLWNKLTGK